MKVLHTTGCTRKIIEKQRKPHSCLSFKDKCLHPCSVLNSYFYCWIFVQFFYTLHDQQRGGAGGGAESERSCMARGICLKILSRTGKTVQGMYTLAWGWAPERPRSVYLKHRRPRKTGAYRVGLGEWRQAGACRVL